MFLVTWWLFFLFRSVSVQAARDGDVRLVDSNRYGTGRVEVFYEGSWGTICHRGWDLDDAEVICRQLNFPNGALRSFYEARFGEGSGRVLLSNVNCGGEESTLLECDNVQDNWAMNDCSHEFDVGVQCSAPNYEGCFQIGFLLAAEGFQDDEMTIEKCFEVCAPRGYRHFWLHNGKSCDCGNTIEAIAKVDNKDCVTDCPGNFDQRCGGRDRGSVYKVEVDLPYVTSPGFPGRFISTGDPLATINFDPQGSASYSFIRFHQLDLPTLVNLSVSSSGRTDMFQGGMGNNGYWIAPANNPIQISFQVPEENIESAGFLLEFGEGSYCPTVTIVSNGRLSTAASIPYTVGTEIRVMCNSGFMAYDDNVLCQADGSFNRDIMCNPSGLATMPPSTTITATQQPQPVATNSSKILPLIPNVTLQGDPSESATMPPSTTIPATNVTLKVIAVAAVSFILFIVLIVILICCSCYFSRKKRRTLPSRRHTDGTCVNGGVPLSLSVSSQHSLGYEIPPEVTLDGYHRHIVNSSNSRDKQNSYYYMENDPNNQMGSNYDSRLHQDYFYEHVQL